MSEKENDSWKITPEIIEEIKEHNRKMREIDKQRVESLKRLGEILDSTLMGIWGHLTNIGATMHGVYKKNTEENFHFIVVGRSEEVIIAENLEEREVICIPLREALWRGEEPKVKFVLTQDEEPKEINGYIVTKFNPEKTPNGHPVKTIEQFLGE